MSRQRFDDEAYKVYTHTGKLLKEDIQQYIEHHRNEQVPRLKQLLAYYKGNNTTILAENNRRKEEHQADHRATHNFAKYVANFMQGYFVGVPIVVNHEKESVEEEVQSINENMEVDALNAELELDCSISGRAYELLNRNKKDKVQSYLSSFLTTFVIYDDTVEQKPIAGVRYRVDTQDKQERITADVYDETKKTTYVIKNSDVSQENVENHFFKGVPIIEYQNDRFRQGDYENVLDLIDLYDASQSDLANYSTDLQDAMLKLVGDLNMMEQFDDQMEAAQAMKNANMMWLKPSQNVEGKESNVDADYIYKQYDVEGMEAYKDRLERDIHKFTLTPDLTESEFKGQTSGEAMRYRLFGLEQKRIAKERMFKRSLQQRYELINNIMTLASESNGIDNLTYQFTPNLPKSVSDAIANFTAVGGELSNETKLKMIPMIVDDPQEEEKRVKQETDVRKKVSSYMDVEN